ncbi:hypothetical protein DXT99_04020 [Pontibacter diazotrophicus]|uniref:T9SS C-terminal target domain-containing protein n=1 Tax=Pontibacter diazotrophicus TaxID=1400979 RepID=A0A3D8LG45_9BACT|nr:hypothetical protein [Pontibacter diazotrophicus]RDV16377.1 hypothetical protein DXT99_04020 [Pontibacter diazotrophicus]
MKTKQKYTLALATVLPLAAAFCLSTTAQSPASVLPAQQQPHVLVSNAKHSSQNYETLSGINLYHTGKGSYQLDFSQHLKENALLSIKNVAQKVVYQKPVSIKSNSSSWRYKLGKMKPGTYLVEVITSDTTYWTKFRIGR